MSAKKHPEREKTPKSILKQPKPADELDKDNIYMELQQELKYWKNRFQNLSAKREKQKSNTLRESIWDKEHKSIKLFIHAEKNIEGEKKDKVVNYQMEQHQIQQEKSESEKYQQNEVDTKRRKRFRGSTRESSSEIQENANEIVQSVKQDQQNENQKQLIGGSNELNVQEKLNEHRKSIDLKQENHQKQINELNSEILFLMEEVREWQIKYNEAVDPIHFQNLEQELLQEFIVKMQQGIQEVIANNDFNKQYFYCQAAAHFEDEKRAYLNQKKVELESVQQEVLELAILLSDRDRKMQQKDQLIKELECKIQDQHSALLSNEIMIDEQKKLIKEKEQEVKRLLDEKQMQLNKDKDDGQQLLEQINTLQQQSLQSKRDYDFLIEENNQLSQDNNKKSEDIKRYVETQDKLKKENERIREESKSEVDRLITLNKVEIDRFNNLHFIQIDKIREDFKRDMDKLKDDCKREVDKVKEESKRDMDRVRVLGRDAVAQWDREKGELQNKIIMYRERIEEYKDKVIKLKKSIEQQEEINEQIEEYRNKDMIQLEQIEQLKSEYNILLDKYNIYDNLIHEKGFEVQQLVRALQEEMQNYAAEIELSQQQEVKYQASIHQLEEMLQREKQLSAILQDTIQAHKQQQYQQYLSQQQQSSINNSQEESINYFVEQ